MNIKMILNKVSNCSDKFLGKWFNINTLKINLTMSFEIMTIEYLLFLLWNITLNNNKKERFLLYMLGKLTLYITLHTAFLNWSILYACVCSFRTKAIVEKKVNKKTSFILILLFSHMTLLSLNYGSVLYGSLPIDIPVYHSVSSSSIVDPCRQCGRKCSWIPLVKKEFLSRKWSLKNEKFYGCMKIS